MRFVRAGECALGRAARPEANVAQRFHRGEVEETVLGGGGHGQGQWLQSYKVTRLQGY